MSVSAGEQYERLLTVTRSTPDAVGGLIYEAADPVTLTVTVSPPTGADDEYTYASATPDAITDGLAKVGTGLFLLTFVPTASGIYGLTQESTDPTDTQKWQFEVGRGDGDDWTTVPPLDAYERFFGRPLTLYSAEALSQATDLLLAVTGLSSRPGGDSLNDRIYQRGIFAMAEAIEINRDSRTQPLSPYRSEQIGSYRYELIATRAMGGMPTGLLWWDQAVRHFSALTRDDNSVFSSSIHVFDTSLPEHLRSVDVDGSPQVFGPQERNRGAIRQVQ